MHPPFSPVWAVLPVRAFDALLRSTVSLSVEDPEGLVDAVRGGQTTVFASRHGELWAALWAVRGTRTQILVSRSPDGELLARLLAGWGFRVVRGSSSSAGFQGARAALRGLRAGSPIGLAIDGPRGPRGVIQEGGLRLARHAGVPMIPIRVDTSACWILKRSWDHFAIPRPGARIAVRVGPRIEVQPGPEGLRQAAARLEDFLVDPGWPRPDRDIMAEMTS